MTIASPCPWAPPLRPWLPGITGIRRLQPGSRSLGMPASQKPGLITAGHRLQSLISSVQGSRITFLPFQPGEWLHWHVPPVHTGRPATLPPWNSPAPARAEDPAVQGAASTAPIPERCWERQRTQDPCGDEGITVRTVQVPRFLFQTHLSFHFWLSTTELSEPGSLKKWTQCAGPPERSLIVCAKNNLNFCFYRIQGPIPTNYRLRKTLLVFQREKNYAVHYQSQMVMFKHKFDELHAA